MRLRGLRRLGRLAIFPFLWMALRSTTVMADIPGFASDAADIGIAAGAKAPTFQLSDQNGRARSSGSLMGRRGLVLVFFRSADW